ncbi:MAG: hypothetical protein U9N45_06320, partial [Gemmatimonadota bacterium]|nr:hypothetical protein [Gemmatimonadota bacterium]
MSNMPEPARDSKTPKVEGDRLLPLLEDRNRLKELLQLIESKRQEVSDEVFSRVREDYDARLESLNREISRQTKNFEATLKDYRNLIENLERAEEMVVESLEELKIR